MKNLVFVITKSEIGGAQTWIYELKNLLKNHYEIYLITSDNNWLTKKSNDEHIAIIPEIANMKNPIAILKIASSLKKFKADVVISNSANAGIYSRLAKLFYKHRHIYVSHGWSCIYNGGKFKKVFCFIEKILSLLSDKILCVSLTDKNNAVNIIGINSNKLIVIRNGVTPMPKKDIINNKKKILFVGRMVHPKRPDLLVTVADKLSYADFYFVGDGTMKANLVTSYSRKENVFFLGEIKNFNSFKDYDIFVLCSESEGLPMSALEAASAGVPIALSNVGGCSELIFSIALNKTNGVLFSNNVDDLYEKLNMILGNYNEYYSTAQIVKTRFDINHLKDKYIGLIEGK
ncbi:glycosyl transferase family 1 [Photorhabdus sp. HUG-39]|uniref:Glycosyltransferase n=2 Tax=Photorhabdus TaxID=29487 RepID=A0ABX0B0G1_9GAMM|nr:MULTISPECIES: glycosyltransferase [Photorhabdus]MDB6374978.1 glycosyltransferase [Photorhabdus bodei]NDL12829.1 glycosyltransferase [Photorhabdus kayaii]NDL26587.1 glycosyltransferase [Photorhabdus kayaii]RAX08814.1 glycosyl transferase family 1 [Photorhabdus sp. HUG-39]